MYYMYILHKIKYNNIMLIAWRFQIVVGSLFSYVFHVFYSTIYNVYKYFLHILQNYIKNVREDAITWV